MLLNVSRFVRVVNTSSDTQTIHDGLKGAFTIPAFDGTAKSVVSIPTDVFRRWCTRRSQWLKLEEQVVIAEPEPEVVEEVIEEPEEPEPSMHEIRERLKEFGKTVPV